MKYKIKDIIELLLVIMMILDCNTIYTRMVLSRIDLSYFFYFIVIIIFLLSLFQAKKTNYKISRKVFKVVILLFIIFGIFLVLNVRIRVTEYIFKYLIFFPFILFYMLQSKENINSIINKYIKCVLVLSIFSLFFYVVGSLMHIIPSTYVPIRWGVIENATSYFKIHFDTQFQSIGNWRIVRNSSIFCEAPMFAFILATAFLLELLYGDDKSKKRNLIILLLVEITTFSVTGAITLVITLIMHYALINIHKKSVSFLKLLKILIFPVVIVISVIIINIYINNKIKNHYNSYFVRIDDYKAEFKAWSDKKILGNGYRDDRLTLSYMDPYRKENIGQSNSIGTIFSEGGLYFALIYYFPLVLLIIKSMIKKSYESLIFCISLVLLLSNTLVPYNYITIFLIAIIYNYNVKEREAINVEKKT